MTTEGLRPPVQERSQQSMERVLNAGAQLLAESGYPAFTIAEVGRRAGASTGLIYTRFRDKSALFEAILLRELKRMAADEAARFETVRAQNLPIDQLIGALIGHLAEVARREAALTKVFADRATAEPHLDEHVKTWRTAPHLFAEILLQRRAELTHPDPERGVDMAFWLTNAGLERHLHTTMWRHWDQTAAGDWHQFVQDLTYTITTALIGTPQAV